MFLCNTGGFAFGVYPHQELGPADVLFFWVAWYKIHFFQAAFCFQCSVPRALAPEPCNQRLAEAFGLVWEVLMVKPGSRSLATRSADCPLVGQSDFWVRSLRLSPYRCGFTNTSLISAPWRVVLSPIQLDMAKAHRIFWALPLAGQLW